MNSALQCIFNSPLMREYFTGVSGTTNKLIFNIAPVRIQKNVNNPMGYGGKFVTAFSELIEKVWD